MEQNKMIFKLLTILTAAIYVGKIILLLLLSNELLVTIILPCIELITMAGIIIGLKYPQINKQYRLKRVDGKLKFVKKVYAPDPTGIRYISMGLALLITSIIFLTVTIPIIWPDNHLVKQMPFSITLITMALIFILSAVIGYFENKLEKQNEK